MINYNDSHAMWKQRCHKEIWAHDDLHNFGQETDAGLM